MVTDTFSWSSWLRHESMNKLWRKENGTEEGKRDRFDIVSMDNIQVFLSCQYRTCPVFHPNSSVLCPLPERAHVVKGSLCGFCRLRVHRFVLDLQTICAVRKTDFLNIGSC